MASYFTDGADAGTVFDIVGSFGELHGALKVTENTVRTQQEDGLCAVSVLSCCEGVTSRKTTITNNGEKPVSFSSLCDKFCFDGGPWSVYTQFNAWENESRGGWQPLVTEICAESRGVRTNTDAVPFAVLWNDASGHGTAFHLIPDAAWELSVRRVGDGMDTDHVEVTLGFNHRGFTMTLAPGESAALPEILYYSVTDKMSMDAWKLHRYCARMMPRRFPMPVIYNSWLSRFDRFTYEHLASQIPAAAELGAEYFVIDAGWFGKGAEWTKGRGDWKENRVTAFAGRMKEFSDAVRKEGMGFGIWLELETADDCSEIYSKHPEMFLSGNGNLLDFSQKAAQDYAFDTVARLVHDYGVSFFKFDFNSSLHFDRDGHAFRDYMHGYDAFLMRVREAFPDVYLERCASGGFRMNLADGRLCDSYWLSDDQSPMAGMRIFRDTVRRMPPQWIERWTTIQSFCDFRPSYTSESSEMTLATDDAIWTDVRSVHPSFLRAFLTGSPIGFSCDLTCLSSSVRENLRSLTKEIKNDRSFWTEAECRILYDSDTLLALQFCNRDFKRIEILVFSFRLTQRTLTVFPAMTDGASYQMGDATLFADAVAENGLTLTVPGRYEGLRFTLKRL